MTEKNTVQIDNKGLCYNKQTRNAEWVIEQLEAESEKPDRHKSKFKQDNSIPHLFRSHLSDYTNSGFDRGHLVPAADIQSSQNAMDETFLSISF